MFGKIGEVIGSVFGTKSVVDKGMELIDDIWESEQEKNEDARKLIETKAKAKVDLLKGYAPFKIAQRGIAFGFVGVFLFIMLNGVLGALYGIVSLEHVTQAREFADNMWLGPIVAAIVTFYFGGGTIESIKKKAD